MSRHIVKLKSHPNLEIGFGNDPSTNYIFGQITDHSKDEYDDDFVVLMKHYLVFEDLEKDMLPYFQITKEMKKFLWAERAGLCDIERIVWWRNGESHYLSQ